MQENRNEHLNRDDAFEPILAADFTPPPPPRRGLRLRLSLLSVFVGSFLLVAATAAWFVLTARSVYVQVAPMTASVEISGGVALRIGERFLIRPGDYRLYLQNEGYHDSETVLSVDEAPAQTHVREMLPLPGLLSIAAIDEQAQALPGTRVQLDGVDVGQTPLQSVELEPGDYQLTLSRERYLPTSTAVTVSGRGLEQAVEFALEPAWAEVSFATEPSGADVIVNGELLGVTPLRADLLQGANNVTLRRAGYRAWQDDLVIVAGEDRSLPLVSLEAADGLVFIRSEPGSANVTINGDFVGQTPLEITLPPDRSHQISLFRTGYQTAMRQLRTRAEESQELTVRLEPVTTPVRITADPPDAELYIDGLLRGRANQTVELLAASQRIEVRKAGYVPYVTNFTSRPGLEQEIRVRLKTEEEARLEAIEPEITTVAGQRLKLFYPHAFTMGASRREPGRRANEALRDVDLQKPFYLSLHPVTNAQYRRFDDDHMSGSVQGQTLARPNQPVVEVKWEDAARYTNWLSEQEGLPPFYLFEDEEFVGVNADSNGYRLPTEAEWEWAARTDGVGNTLRFTWGDDWPPPPDAGNFADVSTSSFLGQFIRGYDDGHLATANVGSFPPNANGLYDMAGNVAEWVHDFYGAVANLSFTREVDPMGPDEGRYRVIRGSAFTHGSITELRLSYRDFGEDPRYDVGFRVARYLGE